MGLGDWLTNGGGKIEPLVDPKQQTIVQSDGSRVTAFLKDGKLMEYLFDDAKTLYQAVRRGARMSNNGPMLGHRVKQADGSEPYVWLHYNDVLNRASNVALAFRELGLDVGQNTFIGIYAKNRPEWIIVEHATYAYSNVLVPLYETLGADACIYIVNQSEMKIVICDAASKADSLLEQKSKCPSLQYLVIMEAVVPSELEAKAKEASVQLLTFAQFETLGENAVNRPEHIPPKPEDLSTICYTSGTTGPPKGGMLTHANVVADVTTLALLKTSGLVQSDVMMSFLPLAHMFERLCQAGHYMVGACVGFYRGDIRVLAEDIKELRPTIVPVVPRVLNRLYDKVMTEVNKSTLKKMLMDAAIAYKSREMSNFVVRHNSFFDSLVFNRVREGMGGRVKLMITGSAPLAENVLTFVRAAMGCIVIEGYGQTECVAACTVSMEGDSLAGHVGMPSPCCAIKLVDVPELGYFAKDQAGEVCVKGYNVFKGYYKDEAQTREALDEDGWLHTGDIGRWLPEGTLKIIDRKKHIFKLSQGEYVAPEKIENIYSRSRFVAQSFVYGESLKTSLVGIVVPDPDVLLPVAQKELGVEGSLEELCEMGVVKKLILDDMISVGKKAGLNSFEQVKDIHLVAEAFSVENDLLTPTLKSKRPKLKMHFSEQLARMYANLN